MLTPALWIGLGALVAMMLLRLGSGRRERHASSVALAAAVWVGGGRADDQRRLQRQPRYLVMPAAVACVLAGTGIGWLIRRPARGVVGGGLAVARCPSGRGGLRAPQRAAASTRSGVVYYQARLTDGLARRHRASRRPGSPEGVRDRLHRRRSRCPRGLVPEQHTTAVPPPALRRCAARGSGRRAALAHRHATAVPSRASTSLGGEPACNAAIAGGWRIVAAAVPRVSALRRRPRRRRGWPRLRRGARWPSRVPDRLALAFLAGVSLALRTQAIHARYWIDEGLSVGISSHPLSDIPGVLRQDGSPPLYYLLLNLWMSVFGSGEARHPCAVGDVRAARSCPSRWSARVRCSATRAAWFAAVLATLNPFLTYYAQETRMYALVALLTSTS